MGKVDLDKMMQQNTRTKKIRTIRRTAAANTGETPAQKLPHPSKTRAPKKPPRKKAMGSGKSKSAMRGMKTIKVKRRSQIGTKRQVLSGTKRKTKWGLKQSDLVKN